MPRVRPATMGMRSALARLSVVIATGGDVQAAATRTLTDGFDWERLPIARGQLGIRLRFSPDMPRGYLLTDGQGEAVAAASNLRLLLSPPSFDRIERLRALPRGCWPLEPLLMPELEAALRAT